MPRAVKAPTRKVAQRSVPEGRCAKQLWLQGPTCPQECYAGSGGKFCYYHGKVEAGLTTTYVATVHANNGMSLL